MDIDENLIKEVVNRVLAVSRPEKIILFGSALAAQAVPQLPEILEEAKTLTPFGVDYRYPGDYPEVTTADAEAALVLATLVRDEIRNRLPGHSLE